MNLNIHDTTSWPAYGWHDGDAYLSRLGSCLCECLASSSPFRDSKTPSQRAKRAQTCPAFYIT